MIQLIGIKYSMRDLIAAPVTVPGRDAPWLQKCDYVSAPSSSISYLCNSAVFVCILQLSTRAIIMQCNNEDASFWN